MYNEEQTFGRGNLFDFRAVCGITMPILPDIPYDFASMQPTYLQPRMRLNLRARQWESGFVPGIHGLLLSSNMYASLLNTRANKVMKGGYKFDGTEKGVSAIKSWNSDQNVNLTIKELEYQADNLGWAFVKMDIVDGLPTSCVVPADQAYFTFNKKKIIDIKTITSFVVGNDKDQFILLMEHRYYNKDNIPCRRYFFSKVQSQYSENAEEINSFKYGEIKGESKYYMAQFGIKKEDYAKFQNSMKEQPLPFKTLGVEVVKGTIADPLYHKLPIGQSLYQRIGEDLLIKYDTFFSLQAHEGNTAPRLILVPQEFNNGGRTNMNGSSTITEFDERVGARKLGDTYFIKAPFNNGDGTSAQPEAINWEIRKSIIDQKGDILREIALNAGMSPENLNVVGELNDNKSGELTTALVQEKRDLLKPAIKMMIEEVLHYLGLDEEKVTLRFLEEDQQYFENMVAPLSLAVKSFLISPKYATKTLLKDLTDLELKQEYADIEEGRQKIIETFYAGGQNDNNTTKQLMSDKDKKDTAGADNEPKK